MRLVVAYTLPPWQAPDEPKHFEYARLLIDLRHELVAEHRLPRLEDAPGYGPGTPTVAALEQQILASMASNHFWTYVGQPAPLSPPSSFFEVWGAGRGTQLHRPSLYYMVSAVVLAPFQNVSLERQLLLLRTLSALLSVATVAVTYTIGSLLSPRERFLPLVAAAAVAALPMNAFIGASASTDSLAALVGAVTALLLAAVVLDVHRSRSLMLLTVACVAAVLTKREFVALVPGLLLAALIVLRERFNKHVQWGLALISVAVCLALALVIGGLVETPPPLRGLVAALNPFWFDTTTQLKALLNPPASGPTVWQLLATQGDAFFTSFWGYFGWFNVPLSGQFLGPLRIVTAACMVGLSVAMLRGGFVSKLTGFRPGWRLVAITYLAMSLTAVVMAFAVALSNFSLGDVPQGRQVFGFIAPIAVMLAAGARALLSDEWARSPVPTAVIIASLVLLDLSTYTGTIAPYYLAFQHVIQPG